MRYIHFIVNPISGKGTHNITLSYLKKFFPETDFKIAIDYTKYKGHAIDLAKMALALNASCIVACGGDGTINEVAQCLVGTNVTLGIIPVGSGNGLASHLSIPKDVAAALQIIKSGQHSKIDAGSINGQYFFSNTGSGFDAQVIKRYAQSNGRTLWAYVKAAVAAAFVFKPRKAVITCNGETISARPFLLFVSNSNQMGYNMGLTPMASLSDGLLDVVIVPELTFFEKLSLGYYVLTHNISGFKKAQHITTDTLNIELPEHIFTDVQIDGEYHNIKTNILEISILPGALNVFPGKKNA